MTAKEKVRQVHPRAYHKRYQTNRPGGGYTLIWAKFSEEQRLASGKTTAEAWRNAWKRIEEEQRRIQGQKRTEEADMARYEATLEQCGWTRRECGQWEDPITGLHEPTSRAYLIAIQRMACVTPPKKVRKRR